MLEDYYGRSRIEGLLSEQNTLIFNKTYGGRPPIEYKFSFDEKSRLYIGAWKGEDTFNGHSVCKLNSNLTQQDADFIVEYFKSFDAMTDEDRAKVIMDYMIGKGQLYVSQDPISGEQIIDLTEEGKRLAEEGRRTAIPEEQAFIHRVVEKTIRQVEQEDDIPF